MELEIDAADLFAELEVLCRSEFLIDPKREQAIALSDESIVTTAALHLSKTLLDFAQSVPLR